MTPVERIEYMLSMEVNIKQKDDAGIYVPANVDAAVRVKQLKEVLDILKRE